MGRCNGYVFETEQRNEANKNMMEATFSHKPFYKLKSTDHGEWYTGDVS